MTHAIRSKYKNKKNKFKGGSLLPSQYNNPNRDYSKYGQIFCFGDLEGQFPFTRINKTKFTHLIEADETDVSYSRRESLFPKTSISNNTHATHQHFIHLDTITKHIVIETNNNADHSKRDAFVFVGDLVDHGKYDIRWLHALVYNPHQESLLCCIGNRDLNKIRRIDESFIVKNTGNLIWDTNTATQTLTQFVEKIEESLSDYKFLYRYNKIQDRFGYITNETDLKRIRPVFNKLSLNKKNHKNNLENRTRSLYAERMTAGISEYDISLPFPDYNYEELVELGLIERNDLHSNNFKCLLIHITNMMMGVIWSEETVAMFPKGCHILNGLYMHYLNMAHIFSKMVTNHNSEVAIVCHGLVNKYISVPIGFTGSDNKVFDKFLSKHPEYVNTSAVPMHELFNIINEDKRNFINLFNTYWNKCVSDSSYLTHNNYKMPDMELYHTYHRFQDIFFVRTPYYKEYIVETSDDLYNIKAPLPVQPAPQKGGSDSYIMWKDLVGFEKNGIMTKSENYDFKYNIYGHSTHGIMPDILYVKDKKRYMIGLDISVVAPYSKKPFDITHYNGMKNAYMSYGAFSYLVFKPTSVKITGIITRGNSEIDPSIKFPIKYSKNINTFMTFKNLTFPDSFISWQKLDPRNKLVQPATKASPYEFLSKSPENAKELKEPRGIEKAITIVTNKVKNKTANKTANNTANNTANKTANMTANMTANKTANKTANEEKLLKQKMEKSEKNNTIKNDLTLVQLV